MEQCDHSLCNISLYSQRKYNTGYWNKLSRDWNNAVVPKGWILPQLLVARQMFTSGKAPFTCRKVKAFSFPNYPDLANFSYISLQNLTNRFHEKQKFGWLRIRISRVTLFDGSVSECQPPNQAKFTLHQHFWSSVFVPLLLCRNIAGAIFVTQKRKKRRSW